MRRLVDLCTARRQVRAGRGTVTGCRDRARACVRRGRQCCAPRSISSGPSSLLTPAADHLRRPIAHFEAVGSLRGDRWLGRAHHVQVVGAAEPETAQHRGAQPHHLEQRTERECTIVAKHGAGVGAARHQRLQQPGATADAARGEGGLAATCGRTDRRAPIPAMSLLISSLMSDKGAYRMLLKMEGH